MASEKGSAAPPGISHEGGAWHLERGFGKDRRALGRRLLSPRQHRQAMHRRREVDVVELILRDDPQHLLGAGKEGSQAWPWPLAPRPVRNNDVTWLLCGRRRAPVGRYQLLVEVDLSLSPSTLAPVDEA